MVALTGCPDKRRGSGRDDADGQLSEEGPDIQRRCFFDLRGPLLVIVQGVEGDTLLRFLPRLQAPAPDLVEPMEFDGLLIDTAQRRVLQGGELVHLSRTEFGILAALAREPGHVITPAELLQEVWGEEYVTEHSLLRTAIWRLRQRLEPDVQTPRFIVTVPGFGYRLGAES